MYRRPGREWYENNHYPESLSSAQRIALHFTATGDVVFIIAILDLKGKSLI